MYPTDTRVASILTLKNDASDHGWATRKVECALQASPHRMEYDPFVIAVAGGTASGKTTVCGLIMQRLHDQCVAILAQDSFYKVLSPAERELAANGGMHVYADQSLQLEMQSCLVCSAHSVRSCGGRDLVWAKAGARDCKTHPRLQHQNNSSTIAACAPELAAKYIRIFC